MMKAGPVDMFIIKVTVTPLLMWLVFVIARKWGSLVAGVAAGLPISSGPISVYLALEHGAEFAKQAALGSLVGLAAIAALYVAYASSIRSLSVMSSCVVSVAVFLAVSSFVWKTDRPISVMLLTSLLVLVVLQLTRPSGSVAPAPAEKSRLDLPARIVVSLGLVLGITGLAYQLGPTTSGLLAPIPVVACPLIVFAHAQDGREAAKAVIRGTTIGLPSVLIFYFALHQLIDHEGLVAAYGSAFLLSALGAVGALGLLWIWEEKRWWRV